MRKRFEQQYVLGRLPIEETEIPTAKRSGALPGLCAALKELFITKEYNERIFNILEDKIVNGKNKTGRNGMDLWQIFVLAEVRLCQNISYDELHDLANHHTMIRQILGVESGFGYEKYKFGYQRIIDNVSLLTDDMVKELNDVIVEFGHYQFKKKDQEPLSLKTDSFVVESTVHFPTDYNLLWDSARKGIDMINKLQEKHNLNGWRKIKDWRNELKNRMRELGRANASGGNGKQDRVEKTAKKYLTKAKALLKKMNDSKDGFPQEDVADMVIIMELERFMELLDKHIDLVERRIIKGEKIPHHEKMFSIFEEYTEWITKGKMRPNVELGKKVCITTDQFNLIVDYQVMDHQADSEIVPELAGHLSQMFVIRRWSFDKGFWHKDNKALLKKYVDEIIMPKKGKCNQAEREEERQPNFKRSKRKHSAIESNINELEHRGLDRCPDKGYSHFKRYVGLAVCAYNLRKIGAEIIRQTLEKEAQQEQSIKQAA